MDKQLIASRFNRSLASYDRAAVAQRHVAERLALALRKEAPRGFRNVAEVGCGTGLFTRQLCRDYKPRHLWLNDLCPDFAEHLPKVEHAAYVTGDAERVALPKDVDLLAACSVVQWFEQPADFFRRCSEALCSDGTLCFSSYGPQTFREIRALTGQGLTYRTLEDYEELLAPWFNVEYAVSELLRPEFPSPMAVLRHLQQTGVTGTTSFRWTPARLRAFCEDYQRDSATPAGVGLTYEPLYIIAKKKHLKNNKNDE